ncbi:MAG: hypothetical protein M2R45_03271 [Verrucomicrobia subdivision 3 bacterium]|nr:hypothetical protein [Limisphaerales bacterium]MCS1416131.1 hypothetical protein [Limisphaerales bacterium]
MIRPVSVPLPPPKPAPSTVINILPVTQKMVSIEKLTLINDVGLMGHGEGGYAAMAAHRKLKENSPRRL